MRKRIGLLVVGLALLTAPMTASAASTWASEATYGDQVLGKLGFGLKNTLLSWTELFLEPVDANNMGENVFVGLGRGVYKGVVNTVLGAAHAVTFPIPQIDVPLVDGGTDLL